MKISKYLMQQRHNAYTKNLDNILNMIEINKNAYFLDLGCDDGSWTNTISKKIKTKNIFGVDLIDEQLKKAKKIGISVKRVDINKKSPFKSDTFDVVHANQVIEHICNSDLFIGEIYRVLKKGGYAIISTENLASWHNVFSLILGYMPFSLTNTSIKTAALGNPLGFHNNENFLWISNTWQHQRVFTLTGWKHMFELHGFKVEKILGSGYYPFGNIFSSIDPRHSAFITFKIRK